MGFKRTVCKSACIIIVAPTRVSGVAMSLLPMIIPVSRETRFAATSVEKDGAVSPFPMRAAAAGLIRLWGRK